MGHLDIIVRISSSNSLPIRDVRGPTQKRFLKEPRPRSKVLALLLAGLTHGAPLSGMVFLFKSGDADLQ